MFQRPQLGETEEDLLRQEEEFLRASEKPFKRKVLENETKPSKRFEILGDIKEKTVGSVKPNEQKFEQAKGFPKTFLIDSRLTQKKKGKKSLFAMQLEKNKLSSDSKMEVEETVEPSQKIENIPSVPPEDWRNIHEENLEKLSKLTQEEIVEEQKKLISNLDPKLVNFLKTRGKQKTTDEVKKEEKAVKMEEVDEEEVKKNLEKYVDSKWINMDFLEKEKLQWIGDIPDKKALEPDQPYSARFDFKGDLQPFTAEIDVRNSLYHHGDEPHRPGYTIQELYQLSRSQVLQQRNVALTTLGNIIRKTKLGYYDRCFDGQLLHKLVESDLFFLLRFSLDENCLTASTIYCLHNLLCNESDEFCLDKLLGISWADEQPLLFCQMDANKDEEKELKDHVVIGCDMVKGVLRTDLLIRLAYVLSNFSPTRETLIRATNCLIRISRHSLEATTKILETPNLLTIVYNNINTNAPLYEGVKLFRVMITHSRDIAVEISRNFDFRFLVSFIEAEENSNISKKEFYLLKLETLYFYRGLLLHDLFTEEFVMWSPCLIRLLLFYKEKVDVNVENDFDFELFSAMTSLIIVFNKKKIKSDSHVPVMMRICLEKWLTQLIRHRKCNFAVSKALGCAFRYFTSHFKAFGVNALDLEFINTINSKLTFMIETKACDEIFISLSRHSYLLSSTNVTRDPENLPSLCSVYDGGEEFLRIVQSSSPLPFFISLVKYLKTVYRISHESILVVKLLAHSTNIRKYVSKICNRDEVFYNWFMKFETKFLTGFLQLLTLFESEDVLPLGFSLLPLLRVDDFHSKKVLGVLCDKNNWKNEVCEKVPQHLASLYCECFLEKRERVGVLNYKNSLVPEDWAYKILPILRGKESVEAVTNILKFISLILETKPELLKRVSHTYRFYNLCSVFLTDSNVFELEIQNALENIFSDIIANQEKVNLNLKFDKNKSFYDLYTELITQYAGVSYGLPIFAKFVLFPLQNRFNVSLRKLLWFEYLHVLRVVTLGFPANEFLGLEGFVEPCETDESLLVAYITSLSNKVILKGRNPFVYNIAVGNVSRFLAGTDRDEKLLKFLKMKVDGLKNEELKSDLLNFRINDGGLL